MNYQDILNAKFSHLDWTITDPTDYDSITWANQTVSKEHLDLLIADDTTATVALVQDARKEEYPDLAEQLDMLFHELTDTGSISTSGNWYQTILAVKNNNPKP